MIGLTSRLLRMPAAYRARPDDGVALTDLMTSLHMTENKGEVKDMLEICKAFCLVGKPVFYERHGNGHINETYFLRTDEPHDYILQRLNTQVFPDAEGLMRNVVAVSSHLRRSCDDPRRVLTLVPAIDGGFFHRAKDGTYWRVFEFVTDGICLDQAQGPEDMRQSGVAFGRFQRQLVDFPAQTLTEIIPSFHDTPNRYRQLHQAIEEDRAGRLREVRPEVEEYLTREAQADGLTRLHRQGVLPTRVTHNDTKLNNVMLDATTRTALCVIDLDTVMPGLAANDFGDAIRFGASTALEDEMDLSKVALSLPYYEAFAEGFLSACGDSLTEAELKTLPLGAKLMTLECGARFLADYLNGDVYFRVSREKQNLDRARTQIKLVQDMERKWDEIQRITAQAAKRPG